MAAVDRLTLVFYNHAGSAINRLDSSAPGHPITALAFENHQLTGCGQLTLRLARRRVRVFPGSRNQIEVLAHKDGVETVYYRGVITEAPVAPFVREEIEYIAQGFWFEARTQKGCQSSAEKKSDGSGSCNPTEIHGLV